MLLDSVTSGTRICIIHSEPRRNESTTNPHLYHTEKLISPEVFVVEQWLYWVGWYYPHRILPTTVVDLLWFIKGTWYPCDRYWIGYFLESVTRSLLDLLFWAETEPTLLVYPSHITVFRLSFTISFIRCEEEEKKQSNDTNCGSETDSYF